jgi:hypothetical protein
MTDTNWLGRVWILVALLTPCVVVSADVPRLIRYQGQAVDAQHVPLEGPYDVTFRLYDAETDGTVVWQELQSNVPLTGGHFSVLLGQVTPLNLDWSQPCWLSIQVGTEPELTPRQRITSVPLAIKAEAAEHADAATTADHLTTPITTSTITDDANSLVPVGAVILWLGANCPSGYSRVSALDGKFLVGGASYRASAGGANAITPSGSVSVASHTHRVLATQQIWGLNWGHGGGGYLITIAANENAARATNDADTSSTAPAASFSGSSFDNRPEFATVLLCQKD